MATATAHQNDFPDLRGRHPREILEWAWATYGDRLMTTTAFGYSGMALFHMMAQVAPHVPIFFIDTGYHFAETLQFRDYCRDKLGMNVIDLVPEKTREDFEAEHGGPIYKSEPDRCCAFNKVAPLQKMLRESNFEAWIAALRRDQAKTRAGIEIIQPMTTGMVKIHPLAEWSKVDVWRYIRENGVPTNPLHDEGYMSIGCAPCTRQVVAGEDERSGRWAGTGKQECGIHLMGTNGEGI